MIFFEYILRCHIILCLDNCIRVYCAFDCLCKLLYLYHFFRIITVKSISLNNHTQLVTWCQKLQYACEQYKLYLGISIRVARLSKLITLRIMLEPNKN